MRFLIALLFIGTSAKLQVRKTMPYCQNVECGALECPASAHIVEIPGHCCPYCQITGGFEYNHNYADQAFAAQNAVDTAEYGGGYKSGVYTNKFKSGTERQIQG